jgi:hypothetical protein
MGRHIRTLDMKKRRQKKDIDREKEYYRLKFEYRNRIVNDGELVGERFEEWWEAIQAVRANHKEQYPEKPAVSIYRDIGKDIKNLLLPRLKAKENRPPRIKDLENISLEDLTAWPSSGYVLVKVRAIGEPLQELVQEFKKVINEELAKPDIKKAKETLRRKSVREKKVKRSKVRFDELRRYLKVYDLKKQGLTIKAIAKELGFPDADENIERVFKADLRKARLIISNYMKNNRDFPGKY